MGPYYSIVVWETFVEGGGKGWSTIWGVWVSGWSSGGLNWLSSDHHGDGNVVVVGGVLGLVSVLLSDGLEGVVTNDLSEGLEGDGVDLIKSVGWGDLEGKSSLLIDWDGDGLGVGVEDLGVRLGGHGGKGVLEVNLSLGSSLDLGESSRDELGGRLGGGGTVDQSSDSKGDYASHIYVK